MVWVTDVETYPNYFCIGFLPLQKEDIYIKDFIRADIDGDMETKYSLLSSMKAEQIEIRGDFTQKQVVDQIVKFKQILEKCKYLVGFNIQGYDDVIIRFIMSNLRILAPLTGDKITKIINTKSQQIINNDDYSRYKDNQIQLYDAPYEIIDLYKIHRLDALHISLKQTAVNLKWHRLQDLPYPYDVNLKQNEMDNVADYNWNDIMITNRLYFYDTEEINNRFDASKKYGTSFLCSSRSSLAHEVIAKMYEEETGLKRYDFYYKRTIRNVIKLGDIIDDFHFTNPVLKKEYETLRNKSIRVDTQADKYKKDKHLSAFILNNTKYIVAKGGLHSDDRPGIFRRSDNIIYRDADVSSFYPRIIINLLVHPEHINQVAFTNIATMLTDGRIYHKGLASDSKLTPREQKHHNSEAGILKIVINSGLFGKLGDLYSFLCDHKALYRTTFNGEFSLLKLIDMLEYDGFSVISANTDGIITKIDANREHTYNEICKTWERDLGFSLEYTDYSLYARLKVNDYVSVTTKGKIKQKGDFLTGISIDKGYSKPIVAIAVNEYLINGVPIRDTIMNRENKYSIYDYCISVKTSDDFVKEFYTVDDGEIDISILQKNIRYYVSKKGGALVKKYKTKSKQINMLKHYTLNIFNDYYDVFDFDDYDVDYGFYIKHAQDIIDKLNLLHTKDLKGVFTRKGGMSKSGISGKLFD